MRFFGSGEMTIQRATVDKHSRAFVKPGSRVAKQVPIKSGILTELVGYQLRRSQTALFHNFAQKLGECNLTPGQFGLLVKIKNNGGISQTELARTDGIERSTLGEVIDRFEERNLVERRKHAYDRRAYALYLTTEGEGFLQSVTPMVLENEREMTRGFTEEERQTLLDLLQKLVEQVEG